jgi:hypothetical protein
MNLDLLRMDLANRLKIELDLTVAKHIIEPGIVGELRQVPHGTFPSLVKLGPYRKSLDSSHSLLVSRCAPAMDNRDQECGYQTKEQRTCGACTICIPIRPFA